MSCWRRRSPALKSAAPSLAAMRRSPGVPDEIELQGDLFDFQEKYHLTTSKIHIPARITPGTDRRGTGDRPAGLSNSRLQRLCPGRPVSDAGGPHHLPRGQHHPRLHASQPLSQHDAGGGALLPRGPLLHPGCDAGGSLMRWRLIAWSRGNSLVFFWRLYRWQRPGKNQAGAGHSDLFPQPQRPSPRRLSRPGRGDSGHPLAAPRAPWRFYLPLRRPRAGLLYLSKCDHRRGRRPRPGHRPPLPDRRGCRAHRGIQIGSDVKIGAGAVVCQDIPDGATVVSQPPRVLLRQSADHATDTDGSHCPGLGLP